MYCDVEAALIKKLWKKDYTKLKLTALSAGSIETEKSLKSRNSVQNLLNMSIRLISMMKIAN